MLRKRLNRQKSVNPTDADNDLPSNGRITMHLSGTVFPSRENGETEQSVVHTALLTNPADAASKRNRDPSCRIRAF